MATVTPSAQIAGVFIVEPVVHGDERGQFIETYRREWVPGAREMIQTNRGDRQQGAVVGLHYHLHQADYWYIPFGRCRVVLHDLREGSPTDGATEVLDLGRRDDGIHDHRGIFIPPGVAHGYKVIGGEECMLVYLTDRFYNPADEGRIPFNDPGINYDWETQRK